MTTKEISVKELIGKGYNSFWKCKKRYRVVKGSRGSKKSKTAAIQRIVRIVQYPLCNYLCVRRFANTIRDSIYADCKWAIKKLGLEDYFIYKTSPLEIIYVPTGQKILFRGLDEGTKVTSITVDTGVLNFVDIEEAYEIEEADFEKLEMSIRGEVPEGYFKQITLLFNPWSANSWLKRRFFDTPDDDVLTLTTTWRCNEWLDESDKNIFLKMEKNNPRRARIESFGEWGISEGLIYEKVKTIAFDVKKIRTTPGIKAAFGLDFGFTDPNAFVCLLIDEANEKLYVFDEWYQSGITNKIIAGKIKEKGYGGQRIICDCAEPKSIQELKNEQIKAEPSRKGRDSVNHGIQLIQNYEIYVHPKCTEFKKEIENYCYLKDRSGRMTDKPDHEFSHGMDAMRYAVTKALLPERYGW